MTHSTSHAKFDGQTLVVLDQTLLPAQSTYVSCATLEEVAHAIRSMQVRGAPLIGIVAAYGMAIAALSAPEEFTSFQAHMRRAGEILGKTRPTAVNLFWAIERVLRVCRQLADMSADKRAGIVRAEAVAIHREDVEMCRAMGRYGAELVRDGETIMTHCNAGALATGGYGTALGVIRAAVEMGRRIRVLARETRPLLQGARLTAWELAEDGIDVTVIPDSAGAHFMRTGRVDRVVVGADRIAANGDTANKIGTYDLAIIAREHGVPFHVAAPYSTVDFSLADGTAIPIEERGAEEMTHLGDAQLVRVGVQVANPAFDVTPARYITSIITEAGIAEPPFGQSLKRLLEDKAA